ncbi:MAG TPA: tetratricopeptide repeat protein [Flavobacteriales bacterium]|nr:tetratricopeptide repeat protein [Flavobacteriales bacterium]
MAKNIKLHDIEQIITLKKGTSVDKVTITQNKKNQHFFTKSAPKKTSPSTVNDRNRARISFNKLQTKIAIEGFLRQKEWHAYFYLSELLQRNAFDLFDKDIKKYIKRFTTHEDYATLLLLKDLELERKIMEGSVVKETVHDINLILLQQLKFSEAAAENLVWRYKYYGAFMRNIHPGIHIVQSNTKKPSGIWQKIYHLRARVQETKNIDEKIQALLEIYKLTHKSTAHNLRREYVAACNNLATFYMISGNFSGALTYYNQALTLKQYIRPALYYTLQYNFVGLCLRNLQFQLAYQSMLKVDSAIQQLPAIAFKWQLLKSMCFAFAGKEKEIKNILPASPNKKNSADYIYFYVIWAIYFSHSAKSETAVQMLETAQNLCKRHNGEKSMLVFVTLLRKYHRFNEDFTPKKSAQKTLELLKKVDMQELSSGNILPLVWLNKFLSNTL